MPDALCLDGPLEGLFHHFERFDFRLIDCDPSPTLNPRLRPLKQRRKEFAEIVYTIHIYERRTFTDAFAIAFPKWNFTTWEVGDSQWARPAGLCRLARIERRETAYLASVGKSFPPLLTYQQAKRMRSYVEYAPVCPPSFVMPVDYVLPLALVRECDRFKSDEDLATVPALPFANNPPLLRRA